MKAATRLGLDDAPLRAINPGLITCAIVGFGQDGHYRDRPAYDDIVQAASGWADLDQRVGVGRREVEIVQDRHHADSRTAQIVHGVEDRALVAQVEARRRLVEEQHLSRGDRAASWQSTRANCTRACSPPERPG